MARAAASTMLWLVLINSTLKHPSVTDEPNETTFLWVVSIIPLSLSLFSMMPIVSLVANTGALIF